MGQETEVVESQQTTAAETEARMFGWKPLEEFGGPPER